jgi:hypothetical protein
LQIQKHIENFDKQIYEKIKLENPENKFKHKPKILNIPGYKYSYAYDVDFDDKPDHI